MTLNSTVLPLSQIDTTLVDVRGYVSILTQAQKIKSPVTRARVLYVIEVSYENANDTVFDERDRDTSEWADMFHSTMCSFSVDALRGSTRGDDQAKLWLAKRGISG